MRIPHHDRVTASAERVLVRKGPPWVLLGQALWGVYTRVKPGGSLVTNLYGRTDFLQGLDEHCCDAPEDAAVCSAIKQRILEVPDKIPHVIAHAKGTDLDFITPPEDGGR